jgi:Asp-tRNA(Asn)/Glu-tRNA(Gln) amidotransferase B subunit
MPGVLPVVNRKAVEFIMGGAPHCQVAHQVLPVKIIFTRPP